MSGLLRESGFFLIFLGFTIAMTWPWARHIRDAAGDTADSYLNAWILWWDYHQTFTNPAYLFHANILYPYQYTLAFSENNYGIALFLFPFYALGLKPLTVHGIGVLLGFAFCGYGAFRLARTITGSTGAGLVAGVAFAFVPYRFQHLPHITYLCAGWIPLLLEALVLYARSHSRARAAWLGVVFFMNALSCIHWFVLTLIPFGLSFVVLTSQYRLWKNRQYWQRAVFALFLASLALLPFLIPYLRVSSLYGLVRHREEMQFFSAHLAHWLTVDWQNKLWSGLGTSLAPYTTELALFPGFVPLLLAIAAFVSNSVRHRKSLRLRDWLPEELHTGSVWLVLGFLGSFGANFPLHRLLFDYVPLFHSIRVPARWAMICFVGLSLLAAVGSRNLIERLVQGRTQYLRIAAYTLIIGLLLFEQRAAPLQLVHGAVEPNAVSLYLKATPMRGGIVELPSGVGHANYLYTLRAADHRGQLVNGVSGFRPPIVRAIEEMTQRRTIPDSFMDLLEAVPVSYLVVHHSALEASARKPMTDLLSREVAAGRLRLVKVFNEGPDLDEVYVVTKTEP